jgi:hypothetical protein
MRTFLMRPLSKWEKAGLALLLLTVFGFGALVEYRSAFLSRRMGDAGCFLRAGWSVRAGGWQLYHVSCDNKWHYNYPPLLAVLMTPLADPPERNRVASVAGSVGLSAMPGPGPLVGATTLTAQTMLFDPEVPGGVPYAWSVAVLYLGNLLVLALAVHLLADALEQSSPEPVGMGCRRWWWLRVLPVLACLTPIGHTLMRGQMNLLLLLPVCGMIAALMRGHNFRAGLWLAGAICLKIFPAYLLLVPLVRRDLRCLAGTGVGLLFGLFLIPAAVLGPKQTLECYRDLGEVLIKPALHIGEDTTRATELTGVTATDNQSFRAVLHNLQHPDAATRPATEAWWVSKAHWLIGGALTLATLVLSWHWRDEKGPLQAVWIGALTVVMTTTSPVCHTHYFVLCVPLLMGILALAWREERRWGWPVAALIGSQFFGHLLSQVPELRPWRDVGLSLGTALSLWAVGCVLLAAARKGARRDAGRSHLPDRTLILVPPGRRDLPESA